MAKHEHTAGPWVLDDEYPDCIYSDDATGSIVARVGGTGFEYAPRPPQEIQANARLIAAGPEMLAALRKGAEWFAREQDHAVPFAVRMAMCSEFEADMKTVLAKIEGK